MPNSVTQAALEIWAEQGAQNWLPIDGNSMRPLIRDGDRVLVRHGTTGIRRGDVIVFRLGEDLAAHRVLCVCQNGATLTFLTKGDNARRHDAPLSVDRALGRVLAVRRDGRQARLDTAAERVLGWIVAAGALVGMRLYGWASTCKQRIVGPQPNRVTAGLRRGAATLFRWALRASEAVFLRWKE